MSFRTRATGLGILSGVAVGVGVGVGTVVTFGSSGAGSGCANLDSCFTGPAGLVGTVHTYGAGVLLVLSAGIVLLALGTRGMDRRARGLAVSALLVLGLMATFGALLASGTLPPGAAGLQFIWLATYIALNIEICLPSWKLRALELRLARATSDRTAIEESMPNQ